MLVPHPVHKSVLPINIHAECDANAAAQPVLVLRRQGVVLKSNCRTATSRNRNKDKAAASFRNESTRQRHGPTASVPRPQKQLLESSEPYSIEPDDLGKHLVIICRQGHRPTRRLCRTKI